MNGHRYFPPASRLGDHGHNSADEVKLIPAAMAQDRVEAPAEILGLFAAFESEKDGKWHAERPGHGDHRIETRHLLASLNVTPVVAAQLRPLGGGLERQLRVLPQQSQAPGKELSVVQE